MWGTQISALPSSPTVSIPNISRIRSLCNPRRWPADTAIFRRVTHAPGLSTAYEHSGAMFSRIPHEFGTHHLGSTLVNGVAPNRCAGGQATYDAVGTPGIAFRRVRVEIKSLITRYSCFSFLIA